MTELSERDKKKADKLKADLINKQQKTLTAASVQAGQSIEKEVVKRVNRIKNNVEIMTDSKKQIIEDLNFLKEHQAELTANTGQTFEEFIKKVAGYSKGYFYQLTANYEFLKENNKIELLDKVDTKIIEEIKKIDNNKLQQEYLKKAETLTRADINIIRDKVRPSDSVKPFQTAQEAPEQDFSRPAVVTSINYEKAYYRLLNVVEKYIKANPSNKGINNLKIDVENIKIITGEK